MTQYSLRFRSGNEAEIIFNLNLIADSEKFDTASAEIYNKAMKTATLKQQAKREITDVLRRYRVSWLDVMPDIDEEIWKKLEPAMKNIRRKLFRERYPDLYANLNKKKA